MTIELGTTDINKVLLGSTEINKVMLGSTEVYSAGITEVNNPNTNIRATGGGSWGNGFEVVETLPANTEGYIEFTATNDHTGGDNYAMFGFSRESDASVTGYGGIRYAIYVRMGALRVFESGGSVYAETAFTNGDTVQVHRSVTGVITYKKNGITFYTSLKPADTVEMKGDGCFLGANDRVLDIVLERGNGPFNPTYDNKFNVTEY